MPKLKHRFEDGIAYFVTTNVDSRKPIFHDALACELFLTILTFYKFTLRYKEFGFVIMPDHVHLVVQPTGEMSLSGIMRRIKGSFSRFYKMIYPTKHENIWQKSYYDEGIRDASHLNEILTYMHNNPVRSGLVQSSAECRYSSCRYYESGGQEYAVLVDTPQ